MKERLEVSRSYWLYICDEQVEEEGSQGSDSSFAQKHDNITNTSYNRVSKRIGPNEFKAVFGSIAEVFASECDLDVGLGINETNDAFNTG